MENVKEPASTVDMTVEVFKAMSKASGENIRFMYSMAFAGGLLRSRNQNSTKTARLPCCSTLKTRKRGKRSINL